MNRVLAIRNRQRACRVDTKHLRTAARRLLEDLLALPDYSLCIHLVGPTTMARINRQFLSHEGPTDVITFDLREGPRSSPFSGEIFICLEVAKRQALEFGTAWPEEMFRYLVHGVLHLQGFDDLDPASRRIMKRVEGRLLRKLIVP